MVKSKFIDFYIELFTSSFCETQTERSVEDRDVRDQKNYTSPGPGPGPKKVGPAHL